jgi:two-component system, NarL family, sensor histidine kinase DesK
MRSWFHIIPKNTGLSIYVWIIFCILPFYFIIRSESFIDIILGIVMLILFFIAYRLTFISKTGLVYLWVSLQMAISIFATLDFGYVYFALFLAFFIGNIKRLGGFLTLYIVHLTTTIATITISFFINTSLFTSQLPFVIVSLIGVILLPFTMYARNKREELENQLESANKQISRLSIIEERQRIARDLHDTLGQKLSLIGLKSDLAGKLMSKNPVAARNEISEIQATARTALTEIRQMVSDMRRIKLSEELKQIQQILTAAQINFKIEGKPELLNTPLLIENVLSMCLREAVTNIVKHSHATVCNVQIDQTPKEVLIKIQDNGVGISDPSRSSGGFGLQSMRDRLEFVNGCLEISSDNGTLLTIRVPKVIQQTKSK